MTFRIIKTFFLNVVTVQPTHGIHSIYLFKYQPFLHSPTPRYKVAVFILWTRPSSWRKADGFLNSNKTSQAKTGLPANKSFML